MGLFQDPRVTLGIGLCVAYAFGAYGWHVIWLHLIFIQVLVAYKQPGTSVAETKAMALVREVAIAKTNECDWLRVFLRTFWPMFLKPKARPPPHHPPLITAVPHLPHCFQRQIAGKVAEKLSELFGQQWLVDKIPTVNAIRFSKEDGFMVNDSAPQMVNIRTTGGKTHADVSRASPDASPLARR